jgi:hypothetical protein
MCSVTLKSLVCVFDQRNETVGAVEMDDVHGVEVIVKMRRWQRMAVLCCWS